MIEKILMSKVYLKYRDKMLDGRKLKYVNKI